MKALVLSGGGEKGAYQAGALQYLCDTGFDPDVVTGISVGAMNGGFLCQYSKGAFPDAVRDLVDRWMEVTTDDVVRKWFPPYVTIPWRSSVYDSSPQREMVDRWIDPGKIAASGRSFAAVAVDWNTGQVLVGREKDPDILDYVKASSSFPLFMEPVRVGTRLCTDGGLRDVAPIKEAMQLGAKDVTIIACSNPELPELWVPDTGLTRFVSFAKRAVDIMSTEIVANDYRVCGLKNEMARTRSEYELVKLTVIRPSKQLGTKSLKFTPEQSAELMKRGYEDAKVSMS